MVEDPERERMRKERRRQDAIREAEVLRDKQRRGEKEAQKAYEDLKDVDKAAYEETRLRAEAAAESPVQPKPQDLIDRLRQKPAKGRGFRRRGERDKDRER